ncbi:hypothetical protein B0A49_12685, partial [Cryomyces minteri]
MHTIAVDTVKHRLNDLFQPDHKLELASPTAFIRNVRILQHFQSVTSVTLGGSAVQRVMHSSVPQSAWQQPYLMHMLLAVSSAHLKRLMQVSNGKESRAYAVAEAKHWQSGLSLYRSAIAASTGRIKPNVDVLVGTTFLSVICAFTLEDEVPLDAFVNSYDETLTYALNPMAAGSGIQALGGVINLNDSIAWMQVLRDSDDRFSTYTSQVPGVLGMPPALVDLCGLNESSTRDSNEYHSIVRLLTPLLRLEVDIEHFTKLIAFGGRTFVRFRPLLQRRDPKALLLLSYWFALLRRIDQWWLNHCNKEYNWGSTKKNRESWSQVKVQTFFATGGLQRYFTVHVTPDQAADPLVSVEDDADVTRILDECRRAKEEHDRDMGKADEMVARTDRTGWFNRTGWPEHLARRNLAHLSHASRMPDGGERLLHQAVKTVDLVIEKSVAGLSSLAIETRRWLKSAKREEADVRPLARLQNPESQRRYAGYWKRFMCYCLRVVTTDEGRGARSCGNNSIDGSNEETEEDEIDEEDQTEDEVDEECQGLMRDARELFPWHGKQKELARELWCALELEDEQTQVEKMLELSGSFIFQTVGDRPFSSALIHFLAVLGIDEEMNRLRTAGDFSYMLAGVVYCTRVIAAEVLLPSADREKQDNAERKRFLRERRRFLADGSYSPMSTMISLLAYGKSIALNTGNSASTQWSRDTRVLRLHGRPIVLEKFKEMIHGVVAEAERVLWEDVMHTRLGERFVIPLHNIEDDVTFTNKHHN